uniref:Tc1-like transposase DDE domain-containing protein n=1 Tax=Latimeria chalumnae TaxID=7897 RepID=H3A326_LATCH
TIATIARKFVERFQKPAPTKVTMLSWEKKLFATGSIKDLPRSGRTPTWHETCAAVEESINRSPLKSTQKRSAELGIPRSTMQEHMKKDTGVRPWRPSFVNELSDNDRDNRKECCSELLNTFATIPSRGKVFFSDECAIYRSDRKRNVFFWSKENPHYMEEIEHKPPHVMMWAALNARHVISPYFFNGSVNHKSYLEMLQNWFVPELDALGIKQDVWLQQDGAPPHYALSVREFLNDSFPDSSPVSPAPLKWPARSPDLTTCDNSLWGYIKEIIQSRRYQNNEELKIQFIQDTTISLTFY